MRGLIVLLALFMVATVPMARAETRVFELAYTTPDELLGAVQPLLGPYESVTVYRNSLVVNAGAGALQRVAALLAELDKPLRNLLISLRRRSDLRQSSAGIAVDGSLQAGDTRITSTRDRVSGSGVTVRTQRSVSTRDSTGEQRVRALEGSAVAIRDGELVAIAAGAWWGPGVEHVELAQGFSVVARVQGEQVSLEVSATDDRIDAGAIRTGEIHSTASGGLGEWIALGGSEQGAAARIDGTARRLATQSNAAQHYEIRVELAP